jgi:hypothetical protein
MDEDVEAPIVTPGKEIVLRRGRPWPQLKDDKDAEEHYRKYHPHAAQRGRLGDGCANAVLILARHGHSKIVTTLGGQAATIYDLDQGAEALSA